MCGGVWGQFQSEKNNHKGKVTCAAYSFLPIFTVPVQAPRLVSCLSLHPPLLLPLVVPFSLPLPAFPRLPITPHPPSPCLPVTRSYGDSCGCHGDRVTTRTASSEKQETRDSQ